MTIDKLIELLAADLKPVDRQRTARALSAALVVGAVIAFGAMLLVLDPSPEMFSGRNPMFLSAKLAFTLSVVATAGVFLPQLARPGARQRGLLVFVALPFIVIAVPATAALISAHWSTWTSMVLGKNWLTCLVSIPLFAIGPFTAVVWALRTGAPIDLTSTGAVAGLVAGGVGATACALPCVDESFPSIALWYGLAIGVCAGFGARLGPWLLRW